MNATATTKSHRLQPEASWTTLDWALAMAAFGLHVFPLEPNGKRPALSAWQKKATRDPEHIRRWWTDPVTGWERAMNYGVTGAIILDTDRKNGVDGVQTLDDLIARNGPLPPTLRVQTPSGGEHLYFKEDATVHNSAGRLGPGLDIRGVGGYVVGPGSTIDGKAYRLAGGVTTLAKCPEWLAVLARTAPRVPQQKDKGGIAKGVFIDSQEAIKRAIDFLENDADCAVEGAGGDDTTYRVAVRVKDFGISEPRCFDLMMDHWNEQCSPPWDPSDLLKKIENAYNYGLEPVGVSSPQADFGCPANDDTHPVSKLAPKYWGIPKAEEIAPREWVLGTLLIKDNLSVMVSPPGGSKSTVALNAALAVVTGREEILGMPVPSRQKVWIYNNEDGENEWKLRLSAAIKQHRIRAQDLMIRDQPALAFNSGEQHPLMIAKRSQDGMTMEPYHLRTLLALIQEENIGVLIVDPFVETHEARENSNEEINRVAAMFRTIAKKANCSVLLIHHSNKPPGGSSEGRAGDMNSARGASSLMGVARVVVTLEGMSVQEAKKYDIPDEDRGLYVRMDDAKANLALKDYKPRWFKKSSIPVATRETAETMQFETVGSLEAVDLQGQEQDLDRLFVQDVAEAIIDEFTTVQKIAACLKNNFPLYAEDSDSGLRKKIVRLFSEPQEIDGKVLQYRLFEDRKTGKHVIEAKETK